MAKLRIFPHRVASSHSITWGNWWYSLGSGEQFNLDDLVEGWDYATALKFGTRVFIDADEIQASTGLDLEFIDLVIMADCSSVQQRFVSTTVLANKLEAEITLQPGTVAHEVKLSAHLVLGRSPRPTGNRSAAEIGARLASSPPTRAILEGEGSRFPTEILRFSETNFGNAPWTITAYFDELNDSFMGTIRLIVNSEHPLGAEVIRTKSSAVATALMRLEVTRALIGEISRRDFQLMANGWDEGSVGGVVDALTQFHLGLSLGKAVHYYRDDPIGFDRLLHAKLPTVGGR
ncbi:hypothetical protein [Dietzia sp. B44]|uniref:hypothetical protein n=1 Tax=Dietzia sp. B44 TaxID=1630633 RepID=UPI0015F8FB2A|nr:hypothetical protein [Dietzia sp. B44]MBB1053150.1 hypothetical protein [Dietzia sp. B44]